MPHKTIKMSSKCELTGKIRRIRPWTILNEFNKRSNVIIWYNDVWRALLNDHFCLKRFWFDLMNFHFYYGCWPLPSDSGKNSLHFTLINFSYLLAKIVSSSIVSKVQPEGQVIQWKQIICSISQTISDKSFGHHSCVSSWNKLHSRS